jgi:hypothetical protein
MQGFELTQAAPIVDLEGQGTLVELLGADGEPMQVGTGETATPVTVRVAGTYSRRYKAAERVAADAMIKRKKKTLTPEEQEHRMMTLAAACVIEWHGIFAHGEPLPCTESNVLAVFTAAPWIYQQVLEAMQDHSRFFTAA